MISKKYAIYVLVICFGSLFVSCSTTNKTSTTINKNYIIYPPPPDTARIQFLTAIGDSKDISSRKESKFKKFVTGEEEEVRTIGKPLGIDIFRGKIYLAELGVGILIIDLNTGEFERFNPLGKGQLKAPVQCSVDDKGYLFVVDIVRNEIVVFDDQGNYIQAIKNKDEFSPTDVIALKDIIIVTSTSDHSFHIFKNDYGYNLIGSYPNLRPGEDGYLYQPRNLFADKDKIYVSDFGGFNVNIFDHQGNYLRSVGSEGNMIGQFARPKGLSVDKEGNIMVVDAAFQNTQIFNKEGQVLMFFGGGPYNKPGDMYMPADVTIEYDHIEFFEKYVDPSYNLKYLIFVTNQYGPDKISVYGKVELKD